MDVGGLSGIAVICVFRRRKGTQMFSSLQRRSVREDRSVAERQANKEEEEYLVFAQPISKVLKFSIFKTENRLKR